MLDMDGMEEDAFCNVRFTVNSLELRPKTGLDGECKNIMVSADITVTAEGMKTLSLPIVTDGYSTCAGLGLRRYGGTLKRLVSMKNQCHSLKKTVELGREISKVIDMWCDVTDCHVRTEGDGTILSGMLTLCVLANDSDGVPLYLEKAIDYNVEQRESSQGGTLMCEGEVTVEKFSFTLTGDATVEIRGELKANTMVYEMLSVSAVTELTVDDSVTPPASVAPLAIYYATAGERLFDIARRYNTTCKAIVDANGGVETVVNTPKALLIPVS
jgi:LysM repeat protein